MGTADQVQVQAMINSFPTYDPTPTRGEDSYHAGGMVTLSICDFGFAAPATIEGKWGIGIQGQGRKASMVVADGHFASAKSGTIFGVGGTSGYEIETAAADPVFTNTTYAMDKGQVIINSTDGTYATITKYTSSHKVELDHQIFEVGDAWHLVGHGFIEGLAGTYNSYYGSIRDLSIVLSKF